MEWWHWLVEGATVGCAALFAARGKHHAKRASAEELQRLATEAAFAELERQAEKVERMFARQLGGDGAELLARLAQEREEAIAEGKRRALEEHRARLAPEKR